jgi:transketolase
VTQPIHQDHRASIALGIRRRALRAAVDLNGAYLGQACSSAEILAVLHGTAMDHHAREELVISPAHYALAHWCAMAETGRLDIDLATYARDGSILEMVGGGGSPGMPFTTGSLAQGLSQAMGLALGLRLQGIHGRRTWVLVSDGELQEGQTWEALQAAAHLGLHELRVVLDLNDSQVDGSPDEVVTVEPVADKLRAFGWNVIEVDGHDLEALSRALSPQTQQPTAVACRTHIWQGIPSLRDRHNLHFVRFRDGELELALADLGLASPETVA